jgi:hypothetical protein
MLIAFGTSRIWRRFRFRQSTANAPFVTVHKDGTIETL